MTPADFHTTIYWICTVITMYSVTSMILAIILGIESVAFYHSFYAKPQSKSAQHIPQHIPQHSESSTTATTSVRYSNAIAPESKILFIMPLLSYSFYEFGLIIGALYVFNIGAFNGCKYVHFTAISYGLGKLWMYHVFIFRIYIVYSDSLFAYNAKLLIIIFIIVTIWNLFNTIFSAFTLYTYSYEIGHSIYCAATLPFPAAISIILLDIIFSILCCYLFVRPLLELRRTAGLNNHDGAMRQMVIKYMILTSVAIISTLCIVFIIAATTLSALISIDVVINCVCMMLFNKKYTHYYRILCCGPIKLSGKISCCN